MTEPVRVRVPDSGRHVDGEPLPGLRLYATLTDEALEQVARKVLDMLLEEL